MEPIQIPIEDVLDLHTFRPKDIADLLENYFDECIKADIFSVRVIHGKGKGIQKRQVHRILQKNPRVKSFKDAPPEAGGWGATVVDLKPPMDEIG
ncbi:MAG: Smr/MutS family protein [Desulfobacterales bacterium]|nr:Smr/MutS family protein [Desulfobacterales bacterium]MDH3828888.1 Smr/MutS family protein [Desulfobacterales bacterium]MDH3878626.1 Smr/MutS family protein [Desulfobacterales bacterium]